MTFRTKISGLLVGALLWTAVLPAQVAPPKPAEPAQAAPAPKAPRPTTDYSKLVDVNSASRAALMKLPGITKALADKIIAGRPYLSKAKLVTRNVLPLPLFQQIRDKIYTGFKTSPVAASQPKP